MILSPWLCLCQCRVSRVMTFRQESLHPTTVERRRWTQPRSRLYRQSGSEGAGAKSPDAGRSTLKASGIRVDLGRYSHRVLSSPSPPGPGLPV